MSRTTAPIRRSHGVFQDLESSPHRRLDDDREIVILERYASREAFAAHQVAPFFKHLVIDRMIPLPDERVVEFNDVAE